MRKIEDATTFYLNQRMDEIDAAGKGQDWKDDYIDELTREGGEFYPFSIHNLREVIENGDWSQQVFFSTYAHVASTLPSESSNRNFAEYVIKIAREYWKAAAVKKADADYDTYFQDKKHD